MSTSMTNRTVNHFTCAFGTEDDQVREGSQIL